MQLILVGRRETDQIEIHLSYCKDSVQVEEGEFLYR